jgi:hypothetical protein
LLPELPGTPEEGFQQTGHAEDGLRIFRIGMEGRN